MTYVVLRVFLNISSKLTMQVFSHVLIGAKFTFESHICVGAYKKSCLCRCLQEVMVQLEQLSVGMHSQC